MGPCLLIPQKGDFYDLMAIYVKDKMPEATLFLDEDHKTNEEHHLLATVAKHGVIIEVGAVAQGVLNHQVTAEMEKMTGIILDFVELYNLNQLPDLPKQVDAFRYLECLTLPVNENNERIGMVHQYVEGGDFKPIKTGDPLFALLNGDVIYYQEEKTVYPCFINEAAYYDNNLAMSLSETAIIKHPKR